MMGWNCNNCGHLLAPDKPRTDMANALWKVGISGSIKLPFHSGELKAYRCKHCGARFLVFEGKQPRIYLRSIMVCVDDGEEKDTPPFSTRTAERKKFEITTVLNIDLEGTDHAAYILDVKEKR